MFIISPYDKGGMLYKPSQKYAAACGDLHPSEHPILRVDVQTWLCKGSKRDVRPGRSRAQHALVA